ncbi:MAG: GNAT family N-acetyltransferase [Chloroflexota bacterium]
MKTVPFSSQYLSPLTALVNGHIAAVPPCWALCESQVAAALAAPEPWARHYPENAGPVESETLCVAEDDLLAAAQLTFADGAAVIGWIVAYPGARPALRRLLDEIRERARRHGCHTLTLARYAFGVGWLGIPLAWPHLTGGLQEAGFVPSKQWVLMAGPTDVPPVVQPPEPAGLRLAWRHDPVASEWQVEACVHAARVADCDAWAIPPYFEGCPGFRQWVTVEWVGVEQPYHRRGIGCWMLGEHLRYLSRQGFRQAILWTETTNLPMQGLAEKAGFKRGPVCQEFSAIRLENPPEETG